MHGFCNRAYLHSGKSIKTESVLQRKCSETLPVVFFFFCIHNKDSGCNSSIDIPVETQRADIYNFRECRDRSLAHTGGWLNFILSLSSLLFTDQEGGE